MAKTQSKKSKQPRPKKKVTEASVEKAMKARMKEFRDDLMVELDKVLAIVTDDYLDVVREEVFEEGWNSGYEEGLVEGRREGAKKAKQEIVQSLGATLK